MNFSSFRIKLSVIFAVYFFLAWNCVAQASKTPGLSIYFRVSKVEVDPSYRNNRATLSKIISVFTSENIPYIKSARIEAYASPEGSIAFNEKLSWGRAKSIKKYIINNCPPAINTEITAEGVGENWNGLRKLIHADINAPRRNQMLSIIDRGLADKRTNSGAYYKKELINLGPNIWNYIRKNYLPLLRMEALIVVFVKPDAPQLVLNNINESLRGVNGVRVEILKPEVIVVRDTIVKPIVDTIVKYKIDTVRVTQYVMVKDSTKWVKEPLFAIKTNLLYDLASVLNVEVEFPIGRRWSVAGEWIFPWWTFDNGKANSSRHRVQLLSANVDVKYWLGDRSKFKKLDGWFLGAYGGSGKYDFEYAKKGIQGEFCIFAGISGGYSHRISKNLYLEYSLGLGYLRTDYRKYTTKWGYDNLWHPIFKEGGKYTWIGPTKAKISFGWIINYKHKDKGGVK